MGDVAISAPLVKEYARQNPDAEFFMLSQPRYEAMFAGVENLTFLPFNTKHSAPDYCGGALSVMRRARQIIKQYSITQVADIHDVLRTKLMRLGLIDKIIGKRVKCRVIDKHRPERARLIRAKNKILSPITPSQRCMEEVFIKLGFRDLRFALHTDFIAPKPLASGGVHKIGIAPFAGHKGKEWPIEYMEEVVKRLSEDNHNRIYLYGGGSREIAIMEKWAAQYPLTELVAGKKTLQEELNSMAELNVMISMDSANMHLASLVGVPVISLWGATHPFAGYNGWRQNPLNAVQVDLPCRPCSIFGAKPCTRGDYACLTQLTPDMVLQKLL